MDDWFIKDNDISNHRIWKWKYPVWWHDYLIPVKNQQGTSHQSHTKIFEVDRPIDLNIVIEIVSNWKMIKLLLMSKTLKFSLSQIPITWGNPISNEKKNWK